LNNRCNTNSMALLIPSHYSAEWVQVRVRGSSPSPSPSLQGLSPSPSLQGTSPSPSPSPQNKDSSPTRVHCRTRVLHHCLVVRRRSSFVEGTWACLIALQMMSLWVPLLYILFVIVVVIIIIPNLSLLITSWLVPVPIILWALYFIPFFWHKSTHSANHAPEGWIKTVVSILNCTEQLQHELYRHQ